LARDTHKRLIEAVQAGFDAARPGATAAALFGAMDRICTGGAGGSETRDGKMMVHEENIVITDGRAQFLNTPACSDMVVLG